MVSPGSTGVGYAGAESGYELRFESLFRAGKALSFPCTAEGTVDLDAMSERAKSNYFGARALIGHDYARPNVVRISPT